MSPNGGPGLPADPHGVPPFNSSNASQSHSVLKPLSFFFVCRKRLIISSEASRGCQTSPEARKCAINYFDPLEKSAQKPPMLDAKAAS